jgi:large subunit ribosomal protein L17
MRHRIDGKKLGRSVGQRNALRRTLITQLFQHERIKTTRAKAQAIRAEAERMITKAKRGLAHPDPAYGIFVRRLLAGRLDSKAVVKKLFDELAPRYAERPGGYTRIYRLGLRKGDAAEMVILELVDRPSAQKGASGAQGGLLGRLRRGRSATQPKPEGQK